MYERRLIAGGSQDWLPHWLSEYNAFRGCPMRAPGAISFSLFLAAGLSAQHGGQPVHRGTVGSVVHPGGGGVHLILPGQNNRRVPAARGSSLIAYPVYIAGTYDSSYAGTQAPADYQQQQQPNITIVMPPQQKIGRAHV